MSKRIKPRFGDAGAGPRCWRFAGVEVDEARRELRCEGVARAIEPKPFDLLLLLLQFPDQLVSKHQLIDTIWAGRPVGDAVIARCVLKLRQALGDEHQRLIKTVHGYGYRLLATPECLSLDSTNTAGSAEDAAPGPVPGTEVPQRPGWCFEQAFAGGTVERWLIRHVRTGETRICRWTRSEQGREALEREVAAFRILSQSLGPRLLPMPRVLDWNLDAPPYTVEFEHGSDGSFRDLLMAGDVSKSIEALAQAAARLDAIHAAGIVHGALTPDALLLREADDQRFEVLVADFAAAQIDEAALEKLGLVLAPVPTAPESMYRAPEGTPSRAADLYALGLMLYQAVIGDLERPIAVGWERAVDDEILREDIATAADLDPVYRLSSAAEFAARLRLLPARRDARRELRAAGARAEELRAALARARRRRRLMLAVTLSLALGLAVSSALYVETRASRDRARVEAATSAAMTEFLNRDLLGAADPYRAGGGRRVTVASVLDTASRSLPERFGGQPLIDLRMAVTLGRAYRNLGLIESARAVMTDALERAGDRAEQSAAEVRALNFELASVEVTLAHYDDAEARLMRVLDYANAALGPNDAETFRARKALNWIRYERGYFGEAEQRDEALSRTMATALPNDDPLRWALAADLVEIYGETCRWAEAEALVDRVIAYRERTDGAGSASRYWPMLSKVYLLHMQGRLDESAALASHVLAEAGTALGENHPVVLAATMHLGTIAMRAGRYDEAMARFESARERYWTMYGPEHYLTRRAMTRIGEVEIRLGHPLRARAVLTEALALSRRTLGDDHPHSLDIERLLAEAELSAGELAAAESRFRHVLDVGTRRMPESNNRLAWAWWGLGRTLCGERRPAEARAALDRAEALFVRNFGADSPVARRVIDNRAALLDAAGGAVPSVHGLPIISLPGADHPAGA